ncbi:RNA methyltransferase [Candidatus Uhrbacteria bacterium]|jgi:RNA methyltransferase, TrmH family|nr:RNA methyltransferase [Candidatus Uhrbacteria bacterium]MBT7717374.1 RNA methyltransferase [Candidatus Uhrbacteria bacterium]
MITNAQEKLIKSLHRKKGRRETGLCLVEGSKVIESAGSAIDITFTKEDTRNFEKLVTTESPQEVAATARIPKWSEADVESKDVIVVLDGVQDPGNVGTMLRLCLGFNASLVLIESADPTSPKVIRSSVGAMFQVPWVEVNRSNAKNVVEALERPIYRMEKTESAIELGSVEFKDKIILVAGSEGRGIRLIAPGDSVFIKHDDKLESLNVASALAIILHTISTK